MMYVLIKIKLSMQYYTMEDGKILLMTKLKDPLFRKYIEMLFELAEHNARYNYSIANRAEIPIHSDIFIFEHQISEIPKEVIYILEKAGVIRRHRIYDDIIEIVNPDILIDVYNLLKKSYITSDNKEEEIVNNDEILNYLVKFVEPRVIDVQGIDIVKKVMLLQLFSEKDSTIRNRIHILLIGEPGTGKTLLLQWQAKVSDGIYRSLRITSAGLSGSLRLTDFNNNEPLLMKADGRILCLDEIDKISKDNLDPLLTAMEEGIVTLSGASMDTIYSAKIRVFASSNSNKFRKELIDRFDYIKYLRKLNFNEITKVISHIIDFSTDKDKQELYFEGMNIIRNHLKKVSNFRPKIINQKSVSKAISDILSKEPVVDSVRQSQKWIRFALAYAKMRKTDVTSDLIYELYDMLKEK